MNRMKLASLLLCAATLVASGAELMAGAAKRKITPDLKSGAPAYLAGFGNNRKATGVHDDLWVRCIAMSTGARPVVICGVDLIGIFWDDVQKIRAKVPNADVIIAATHVHEGPDTMGMWGPERGVSGIDNAYNAMVVETAATAARDALVTLRPATVQIASIKPTDVAGYFDDSRPPVVNDGEILALAINDMRRERIATLVNWANHPESLGSKNTLITADWPAALYEQLESQDAGTVVYINGAVGGMQSPLGAKLKDPKTGQPAPPETFRFAEIVGQYVAGHVRDALEEAPRAMAIDEIVYRESIVRIPVANQAFLGASAADLFRGRKQMAAEKLSVSPVGYLALRVGGKPVLEVALIPGELYPELSVGGVVPNDPGADLPGAPVEPPIKAMFTAPYRMLFGLANDEIGYIIPKSQWDEKPPFTFGAKKSWYGEVNSVGPDAAPVIAKTMQDLVRGTPKPLMRTSYTETRLIPSFIGQEIECPSES